jgi:lipid-A-disaccharide synthase
VELDPGIAPTGHRLRVVLVAGEASGDQLGAALISAIARRNPTAIFEGVAGPEMRSAGCESWYDADELAVMGLTEVVRHLPRLLGLRRDLVRRILADPPDVVIGIDAPDFNLGLETKVRAHGVPTVHYVSPSVWAWRKRRVYAVRAAADLVLCLLPFEPGFYAGHQVRAEFVGHPLADAIPPVWDKAASRHRLGLPDGPLVALLPGSRSSETSRLAPIFAETVAWLRQRRPDLGFVVPLTPGRAGEIARHALCQDGLASAVVFIEGQGREVMGAADTVLAASGTAVLEAALIKRPTVVAYRLAQSTAFLLRALNLVDLKYYSLPNLLTDRELFPEFIQEQVTAEQLGPAVLAQLEAAGARGDWYDACVDLHTQLAQNASASAAELVLQLTTH